MLCVKPSVNNLSFEELREELFHDAGKPVLIESGQIDKYQKFSMVLEEFPIHSHKICFIAGPQMIPEKLNLRMAKSMRYQNYPPQGFLNLSAAIRKFMPGWDIKIIDLNHEALKRALLGKTYDFDTLLKLIPDDRDIYGVTMMFKANEVETLHCMKYLMDKGKFVIAGGVQSTADFFNLLKLGFCRIVVKKEGEAQICKLLNLWEKVRDNRSENNGYFQKIFNLAFKYENEIISFENKFEDLIALDIRDAYSLIDLDEYNRYGSLTIWCRIAAKGRKWTTLVTNRGCRGKCIFCQVTDIMEQGVRSREVGDVIDEISFLYHKKGVRHLEIVDDDFLANRDRLLELLNRWARLKLDLTYSLGAGALAISIDEKLAQAMADAGCVMTGFGVETGNLNRLKNLRKPITLEGVKQSCDIFKKNHRKIWLQANFILGFPNETLEEITDTFNFAKDLNIDFCQSAILTPIIGTPIHENYVALNDERVINSFGKDKMAMHTLGRALVSRGLTFDDVFKEVYDFRTMDPKKVLTIQEVQQFQIYFHAFINLLGSINLKDDGMPEKIKSFTDDVLRVYAMDPIVWGVNARAALALGDGEQYETSLKNYKRTAKESRFWSEFFEIYDVPKAMEIPI